MKRNTAGQTLSFQMTNASTGAAVTTGTPAVYYTLDGGSQATGTGTPVHKGNGEWSYPLPKAETDAEHGAFTMVLTNAVSVTVNEYFEYGDGNTYYVATTGNDSNDGLTSGTPWLTIDHALGQVSAFDTVIVADGTYSERIIVNGDNAGLVTIQAENIHGAIITNSSSIQSIEFDGGLSRNWKFAGFQLKLADGTGATGNHIRFEDEAYSIEFEDIKLVCPDDAQSTDYSIENNANGHIGDITFRRLTGDLENEMDLARLSHHVGSVSWIDLDVINSSSTGINVDDFHGTHIVQGGRVHAGGNAIWYYTPLATRKFGADRRRVEVEGVDINSTSGRGVSVSGSAAHKVSARVERNSIDSLNSAVYLDEYVHQMGVTGNNAESNSSEPCMAFSADGVTGEASAAYVEKNKVRNGTGHGLIFGQNVDGGSCLQNDVDGGDQGIVIKGSNLKISENVATTGTGSCILVKGGTKLTITKNVCSVYGTSGTIRCIDIREQDAGVLDQRDPDQITIIDNDMYASGSAAQGLFIDSANIGNDITERANRIHTDESAAIASIRGNTVTTEANWKTAYSGYAISGNGSGGVINADAKIDSLITQLIEDRAEPGQGAPPASASLAVKVDWVYTYLINEKRQDATELELVSQDGTTVIAKSPVSDDGTTTTIGKMVSGA